MADASAMSPTMLKMMVTDDMSIEDRVLIVAPILSRLIDEWDEGKSKMTVQPFQQLILDLIDASGLSYMRWCDTDKVGCTRQIAKKLDSYQSMYMSCCCASCSRGGLGQRATASPRRYLQHPRVGNGEHSTQCSPKAQTACLRPSMQACLNS